MLLLRISAVIITMIWVSGSFAATPQYHKKVALVIGNSEYTTLAKLKNATGDATTIAHSLSNLGFTVFLTQNTTHTTLKDTLSFVAKQTHQAEQVIIYFAGHGHSKEGAISLLTVDAKPSEPKGIKVTDLLEYFNDPFIQKAIIIDACLEIANTTSTTQPKDLLLPANLTQETAFIFATSYGQTAYDGTGKHSLFAGAFLDRLYTHETDLIGIVQAVRSDVINASKAHQLPITLSTLTRSFHLGTKGVADKYGNLTQKLFQSYSSTGFSSKPLLKNLANGPIK